MNTRVRMGKDGLLATMGIVVVLACAIWSFKDFFDRCFDYTYDTTIRRLSESAKENVDVADMEFGHAQEYMKSVAASLSPLEDVFSPPAFELLGKFFSFSSFNRMWIISRDGRAYNTDGRAYNTDGLWLDVPYYDAFLKVDKGQSGVLKISQSLYNGKEVFFVFSPIFKGERSVGVVCGVLELNSLVVKIANEQFNGFGYVHVFDRSGEMIITSDSKYSLVDQSNIWDFFKTVKFEDGSDADSIYQNVQKGEEGFVTFRKDDEERVGYYLPLGVNNWYMISIASKEIVKNFNASINSFTLMLVLQLILCFAILIAGIIYYSKKIHGRVLEANNLLNISNQRFRIAAFHLSDDVIEYDIHKETVYRIDEGSTDIALARPIEDLAGGLVKGRLVTDEALSVFRRAVERLRQGEKRPSCVLEVFDTGRKHEWYEVVLTTSIFDNRGKPVRAIGTIKDITRQRETAIRFAQEEQYRLAMMSEAYATFVFDVTKGRYLYGDRRGGMPASEAGAIYKEELNAIVRKIVHQDDRDKVRKALSLTTLKDHFDKGGTRIEFDFKGSRGADGETWLHCVTHLVIDPETKDLIGYVYIKDITEMKRSELELKYDAERDSLTGLYNRNTANRLIKEYLEGIDPYSVGAFFIIDLDRFKDINDTYGHAAGDEALRMMADRLRAIFRQSDIVGRMGGDEFIALIKDSRNQKAIENKAESVCRTLKEIRISADQDYRISGSVGVCIIPRDGNSLATLYTRADLALYSAKKAGKDRHMVFSKAMESLDRQHSLSARMKNPEEER